MPFWKCFPCMRFQNEEVILKLQYSNCALSDVPPDVSQYERTLEELYLSSNRIRALSPQLFYCQGLRVLFVNDNDLESLPSAIGSLRHLENLNLGRNSLASIPENIKLCKNLMRLDLSLNNLQRLPDAITSLISLQELLLNETNLEFLPANFGRLVNLRILELRSNNLITLPKSMSRLSNLRRIDIGANEFTELPEVICQLGQLRELWIDVNRIRRISPNVSNLRELKHFEANNNLLSSLPNEISNWRNLEVLSVSTNDMKTLPFSIGMLKNLVTLQCEANQLRELPDSICHLENLEEFNISHNFLLRLPSTIGMLKKLCFFCADENILRCLPPEICSCSNLAVLSIRSNKIDELPPNIGYLENLHVLNLVDNNITQLPVSVLSLSKLTALWISDNQSQPLVPLQYLNSSSLTCFMLPQQSVAAHANNEKAEYNSDNDSGNSWPNAELEEEAILNGRAGGVYFADQQVENSKFAMNNSPLPTQTARICFAQAELNEDNAGGGEHVTSPSRRICFADEVKGSELLATRLMRSPTPYPKELRLMAKYVRNNHQQQQQKQTIDDMVRAQAIGPASSALPGDQVDGSLYISVNSQASGATVEGVKEARVLFNPSGNAVFPQQIQNSINYPSGYVSQAGTVLTPLLQQQQHQQQQQQQQQQQHQQQQQQLYYQNYRNPINQTTKMIQQQQPQYQQQQPHHQEQESHHQEQQSHHQQQKQQQQPDYLSSMYELQLYESSLKHQSANKPPPYHIALNFTKKSREDLLNFDTLRTHLTNKNGNEHEGNEIRIQCEDDDQEDCNTEYSGHGDHQSSNPLNGRHCLENDFDNQNNNSSAEFQSGNMPLESGSVNNAIEIRVPPRSSSTTTWLFGLHKNPTVKQVAIKKDNGIGFEIQERPNQGIYVRGTHPNTSAASLLYANDKLLEVDGYDFSKICLLDAQQILENSGPVINVMISRT